MHCAALAALEGLVSSFCCDGFQGGMRLQLIIHGCLLQEKSCLFVVSMPASVC